MSANVSTIEVKRQVKIKSIALPTEHGSWGFLFEPLAAAAAIAPSFAAVWIALLIIGAFLTRQPLKVWLTDLSAKRNLPQTSVALRFVLIFGAVALIGLLGSLYFAKLENFVPFLTVLSFGIYQIYCDVSRKSRELIPELTGAIAISSSAAVIASAGGLSLPVALALWGIFVARLIPSILYVRSRLRLEKGKDFSQVAPIAAHFSALIFVVVSAFYGLTPYLPIAMFAVLTIRSIWGLSPYRKRVKAMKIGIWEVIYGTLTALSVIFGYYLGI